MLLAALQLLAFDLDPHLPLALWYLFHRLLPKRFVGYAGKHKLVKETTWLIFSYTNNLAPVIQRLSGFVANQNNNVSLIRQTWNEMVKHQHSRAVLSTACPHRPQNMSMCAPGRAEYIAYSRSSACRHSHKPHAKDIREIGGTWSLIWSIGRIPEQIISALVEMKDGITRPGQSQRHRPGSTYRVYTINNQLAHQGKSVSMEEKGTKKSNAQKKHGCKCE